MAHGGNIEAYIRANGREPLDFSSNVSPFGMAPEVLTAAEAALQNAHHYPDPDCRALTEALAGKLSLPEKFLCFGNGAADLIYRFALATKPKRVLLPAPTFSEYENAAALAGSEIKIFPLPEQTDFLLTEAILSEITAETDAVFLCEPNNPTGRTAGRELLLQVLHRCVKVGARLFLDECFLDFLPNPEEHTLLPEIADFPNLILLRAFTKLHGMAGLRLGYCISSDEKLLSDMKEAGQPWSVSTVAHAAGLAAISDEKTPERMRSLLATERPFLFQGLTGLGFRVIPGEANFLLFRANPFLGTDLEQRGILLRGCQDFSGLSADWYRTAIRMREDNERLLSELRALEKPIMN